METYINRELIPTETCIVCTEPFSAAHQPVALPCRHIFGHECIKKWLRTGRGNTNSCPFCRHAIFNQTTPSAFNATSIWKALCEQPPERLHMFLSNMWDSIKRLWKRKGQFSGHFTIVEILDEIVIPALAEVAGRDDGPFADCYNLVTASWNSLGRPNTAQGLAIPLVRLARLMSQASPTLPAWLSSVPRMNLLFWKANAVFAMTEESISWNHILDAADLDNHQYFDLLHLYTVLISQGIAHTLSADNWPSRRHEIMNLVVEQCCKRIGGDWSGRPPNELKDLLVVVYEELRRYQLEKNNLSLRGHDGEEHVVRGFWAVAMCSQGRTRYAPQRAGSSPARAQPFRK